MPSEYVEMTGSGAASGTPDVADLTVRLEHGATEVAEALAGCAGAAAGVVDRLRAAGMPAADLRTESIRVDQRWNNQSGTTDGYTASQTLSVRVRDVSAVGAVVTELAAAGGDAFRMDSLAWSFSDPDELATQARERAWADARAKAEQVATLAGRSLGTVVRLRESADTAGVPRPMLKLAADAGAMPAEAGEATVTASLLVRWLLVG